jgi:hypothetical protein
LILEHSPQIVLNYRPLLREFFAGMDLQSGKVGIDSLGQQSLPVVPPGADALIRKRTPQIKSG